MDRYRHLASRVRAGVGIGLLGLGGFLHSEERQCEQNLRAIHDAVGAYHEIRSELPPSLSALVQEGFIDQRLLICPLHTARWTNRPSKSYLGDHLDRDPLTLYIWEYATPDRAAFHNRQREMGAGDWVPIVRCREHAYEDGSPAQLNLSIGGGIFLSGDQWEYKLRHLVPYPYLAAKVIIMVEKVVPLTERFPTRSPYSELKQIDLTNSFNGALSDPWAEGVPGEEAPEILALGRERRIWKHGGIDFEIRGVVQIEGTTAAATHPQFDEPRFPFAMREIDTDVTTHRLHLLCGVIRWQPHGVDAAQIVVTDDSGTRQNLDLRHGIHVNHGETLEAAEGASIAWSRSNPEPTFRGAVSISHVIFPLAEPTRIRRIEFVSKDSPCYPFLIAITAE